MSQPRKHHYCPKSYLASFTPEKSADGSLWVFDRIKKASRKSKPILEAHQRDFYRIEVDSGDPFLLEKEFSEIEEGAIRGIKAIEQTLNLPNDEDFNYLINFIGLLSVRTPSFRKKISSLRSEIAKKVVEIACATKERFNYHIAKMKESGIETPDGVSFEDMQSFIKREAYTIEVHQNTLIEAMLTSASKITDLLMQRSWLIFVAENGRFVTSDNPVSLVWSHTSVCSTRSPGFALKNTEVILPLSETIAIVGIFETPPFLCGALDEYGVASLNSFTALRASRFVYGSEPDFIWKRDWNSMLGSKDLFAHLKIKEKKQ